MTRLRPMTEGEYEVYISKLIHEYAAERAEAEDTPAAEMEPQASAQVRGLLPDGLQTAGHAIWIVEDAGRRVGVLWVQTRQAERRAFIYDIAIEESERGKGYGSATLAALEDALRPQGITHIALSVFGQNSVARSLYDKMGYRVAATYMLKRIE